MKQKKNDIGFYQRISAGMSESLQEYLDDLSGEPCNNLYKMTVHVVEEQLFRFVLAHHKGVVSAAAQTLGISRTTLIRKLRHYGIRR